MIDEAKILEILKDAFGALDDALGDSDFPVETDEEEREYHPTQYAARRVSEVIQILEPARAAELLRAADTQATTEAIAKDIHDYAYEYLDGDTETFRKFRRFLRERLGRS